MIRTFILTVSDKGSRGERADRTGPAVAAVLPADRYAVTRRALLPDDRAQIASALRTACDSGAFDLILTNGGTGFSPRDWTPEATLDVVERPVPGIPEAMRLASLAITPRAALSRAAAGIRGRTLIVNLPGSPKAAVENLSAVLETLPHGIDMLRQASADCADPLPPVTSSAASSAAPPVSGAAGCAAGCASPADCAAAAAGPESAGRDRPSPVGPDARVVSVNVSERKGTVKHEVPFIELKPDWGIAGDAHAGKWHRQVSLLAEESIDTMRDSVSFDLKNGIFAENINTVGVRLKELPVGTVLQIGPARLRVTQIGKQCHNDGCAIQKAAGTCVMPTEGIFAEVLEPGVVRAGDVIRLVE